jgi:hypothetical protein
LVVKVRDIAVMLWGETEVARLDALAYAKVAGTEPNEILADLNFKPGKTGEKVVVRTKLPPVAWRKVS